MHRNAQSFARASEVEGAKVERGEGKGEDGGGILSEQENASITRRDPASRDSAATRTKRFRKRLDPVGIVPEISCPVNVNAEDYNRFHGDDDDDCSLIPISDLFPFHFPVLYAHARARAPANDTR